MQDRLRKKKISKKIPALSFFLWLGIALLGACSKKPETEGLLKLQIRADARSFDPAFCEDQYSAEAQNFVYEGLLEYEYLKRPHQLKAQLAEAMPKVSADGLTYTFKIRKGVRFSDHPAFPDGKGRELKAYDFIYSYLRLADPKMNAPTFWVFDNHIKGLNTWRTEQAQNDKTDFNRIPAGLRALDDYTLQIQLTAKYPQLLFVLAMPMTGVVAREVVEAVGKEFVSTPIGTGPYRLVSWARNSKLVFEKNPNFHEDLYPSEGETGDREKGLLADAGKAMPFMNRVELYVYVEESPRWLNFLSGATDIIPLIPKDYFASALDFKTGKILPELEKKGIVHSKYSEEDTTYIAFNVEDPLIKKGGANLRKAIALAMDKQKQLELFYNNSGIVAQSPIPPGIAGYDVNYKNPYSEYNVAKAKEYLVKAGFPGGKGLELVYESSQGTDERQMAEKMQKELAEIGITMRINVNQFAELTQKLNEKRAQMWGIAWAADYPDAENFLQLLYGPNKAPSPNSSNFDNARYNKLFEQMRVMTDSPTRRKIIREMQDILAEEMPWIPRVHRLQHALNHAWLQNYKAGYVGAPMPAKFLRVDFARKQKGL